jgi:DNA helicase HerA-like ATPase
MPDPSPIFVGASSKHLSVFLQPRMANRHGLIAGATGTGKTVTLQTLAEGFARMGTTVFTADVKGDLSGLARAGKPHPKIDERVKLLEVKGYQQRAYPAVLWDLKGNTGHPIRTTVSEMGPLILARLLELSDPQSDALHLVFKIADDKGLLLLDLKDLKSMCNWMSENSAEFASDYGKIASTTFGSLLRKLVVLEEQLGTGFFGEPALEIRQLIRKDFSGNGLIHVLDARELIQQPRLYSTFMLWLLSELFEDLEEVGDLEAPRMVFFFDEAHLLFNEAPKALLEKIEQVVRLVRSKGVGIYFITQNPIDLPETVLGQLGNRVQHALRAFTPRDQKAVRAAAETFRSNPDFSVEDVISQLAVGEALVSVLDETGTPSVVERVFIAPPESRIGPIDTAERNEQIDRSPYRGVYDTAVDRESAYELLKKAREQAPSTGVAVPPPLPASSRDQDLMEALGGGASRPSPAPLRIEPAAKRPVGRPPDSMGEVLAKTVVRSVGSSIGSSVGRSLVRGVLGSLLGGRRR